MTRRFIETTGIAPTGSRNRPAKSPVPLETTVGASALPVGAATEAKQDTEIASLATIAANQVTQQTTLDSVDASLLELVEFARGGFEPSEPTLPFLVGAS